MWLRFAIATALLGSFLALQACGKKVNPEESCNFVQNSELQRVSWGANTPVLIYVDSSVPGIYFGAIRAAVEEWNNSIGREVLRIGGWTNKGGAPANDGANIIYWLTTWEAARPNEQARTTVHWAGDRIYEADIRINAKDFDYFWGEQPMSGRVDIQSLVLHELGHVLGLAHTEGVPSVMAKTLPNGTVRRETGKMDRDSLRCEY